MRRNATWGGRIPSCHLPAATRNNCAHPSFPEGGGNVREEPRNRLLLDGFDSLPITARCACVGLDLLPRSFDAAIRALDYGPQRIMPY